MDQSLLRIYLNDHLAGSVAGRALLRRLRRDASPGSPDALLFDDLHQELGEEQQLLETLIDATGGSRNPVKQAMGWTLEKLGRLKLNGRLLRRSPLSPFIELEGMCIGVLGKQRMWVALAALASHDPRLAGRPFGVLAANAQRQFHALEAVRLRRAERAFLGAEVDVPRTFGDVLTAG